ncbi:hypothetical protein [Halorubrum californiense]|uniref:hypothetical protein n=1 Tax=Halorubrum californiense TaxID=416585 RepID=UPI00126935C3|nr:hypothetical protein [Halorubrum californiense]
MSNNHTLSDGGREANPEPPIPEALEAIHDQLGLLGIRANEAHAHLSALRSLSHDQTEIQSDVATAEAEALVRQLGSLQEELETAIDLAVVTASETKESADSDDDQYHHSVEIPQTLWNTSYGAYPSVREESG